MGTVVCHVIVRLRFCEWECVANLEEGSREMIKRMWNYFLSPDMGWVIRGSFLGLFFPEGAAQGVATIFLVLCLDLAAIRSLLLLFLKEKRQVPHWNRGFWIGIGWLLFFLLGWLLFGESAFLLWTYPVLAWTDLDGLMFVR